MSRVQQWARSTPMNRIQLWAGSNYGWYQNGQDPAMSRIQLWAGSNYGRDPTMSRIQLQYGQDPTMSRIQLWAGSNYEQNQTMNRIQLWAVPTLRGTYTELPDCPTICHICNSMETPEVEAFPTIKWVVTGQEHCFIYTGEFSRTKSCHRTMCRVVTGQGHFRGSCHGPVLFLRRVFTGKKYYHSKYCRVVRSQNCCQEELSQARNIGEFSRAKSIIIAVCTVGWGEITIFAELQFAAVRGS